MLAYDETRMSEYPILPRPSRDGAKDTMYYMGIYEQAINQLIDVNDTSVMFYSGKREDGLFGKQPKILHKQLEMDGYIPAHIKSWNYGDVVTKKTPNAGSNISFTLAVREISNDECLVAVILRGTDGPEWYGNMEIGKGSERHYSFEKANKDLQRVLVDEYIKELGYQKVNFFITGHSRGAAVGNLLAADLIENGLQGAKTGKVFAYAFATPNNTTVNGTSDKCKNIFNFYFTDDFVPQVPLEKWDYNKYGVTFASNADTIYNQTKNVTFIKAINAYVSLSENRDVDFNSVETGKVISYFYQHATDVNQYYTDGLFDLMHKRVATAAILGLKSGESLSLLKEANLTETIKIPSPIPGIVMPVPIPVRREFYDVAKFFVDCVDSINDTHQPFTYWLALKCGEFNNLGSYSDGGGDL